MILFNDFTKEVSYLRKEINKAIQRVLDSGWFILGKELETFEKNFANYIGTRFCVGVASGTEAIALALMANDIGRSDEVITTNLTAFPTITGILQSGAKPIVVDILNSNGLIDYNKIEAKISKNTKAVIPVHLYGQSCNFNKINVIAKKNNLVVIEDCAQSTGATYQDIKCGALGSCGAFSFYPTKNLGAYGDGGAITTNSEEIYNKLVAFRNYGQTKRYYHETKGINSRLDEIQAAILNVKLNYLDEWNNERRKIAAIYRSELSSIECLMEEIYGKMVYHIFAVKSVNRDKLIKYLQDRDIQIFIHYPIPINRQKAFLWQKKEKFQNSEAFSSSVLSLPIYPGMKTEHIKQIIQTLNAFQS